METKLILIARVSDIEQRKALPAQKLRLERYAEQKQPTSLNTTSLTRVPIKTYVKSSAIAR